MTQTEVIALAVTRYRKPISIRKIGINLFVLFCFAVSIICLVSIRLSKENPMPIATTSKCQYVIPGLPGTYCQIIDKHGRVTYKNQNIEVKIN